MNFFVYCATSPCFRHHLIHMNFLRPKMRRDPRRAALKMALPPKTRKWTTVTAENNETSSFNAAWMVVFGRKESIQVACYM